MVVLTEEVDSVAFAWTQRELTVLAKSGSIVYIKKLLFAVL